MNSSLASADFSKGRRATESSNEPLLHSRARNLITRARSWLSKLLSFAIARVLMILFVGFAAGVAWQSYSGAARKAIASWSPHLAWVAPAAGLAHLPSGTKRRRSLSRRRGRASTSSPPRFVSSPHRLRKKPAPADAGRIHEVDDPKPDESRSVPCGTRMAPY